MNSSTEEIASPLLAALQSLSSTAATVEHYFHKLPGSPILVRYIRSSYQNDPWRSLLELSLVIYVVWTFAKPRTRGEGQTKYWVNMSEKDIDSLVEEYEPAPLVDAPGSKTEMAILPALPTIVGPASHKPKIAATGKIALNLASPNWSGFLDNERLKEVAIKTLREYGTSPCGPPGFYGTLDVHTQLEQDLANFVGQESAIIYAQAFSTVSSVIPAFSKRGDIVVVDKAVGFGIQKGVQISRSTVKWFEPNDMEDLERVLKAVERDAKRKGGPLKRRFIITEGIFENTGVMANLPRIIELKKKYKFRLLLDESFSFGMVGKTGRGVTEYFNIPGNEVDITVGSMANGLNGGGGFCAGSTHVVKHQRINGSAFVYSAALPGALATCGSEAIRMLSTTPQIRLSLVENIKILRTTLSKLEDVSIYIPSDPASALIHILMKNPPEELEQEEKLLQDVVDEALAQGVLITRAARLRGQENEMTPTLKIMVSAAFTKKEMEKASSVLKSAITKCLGNSGATDSRQNDVVNPGPRSTYLSTSGEAAMTKAVIGQVSKRYTILTFALYSSTYDRLDQFSKMSVDNTTSPAAIPSPPATLASIPSEDIVARKVADFIVNTGIGFSVGVVSSVLLFRRRGWPVALSTG
ncbi:hypothetical protein QFC24_006343 [Naganishia onofrii]|uniref:Uncharacterized protein n=1 Tax=Naganishia onofrii TaxID=1851511 RepID=A0ACC2X339_9TREE|nr:hypothetical protein QFC24_006343 [Naganishia onofrii]